MQTLLESLSQQVGDRPPVLSPKQVLRIKWAILVLKDWTDRESPESLDTILEACQAVIQELSPLYGSHRITKEEAGMIDALHGAAHNVVYYLQDSAGIARRLVANSEDSKFDPQVTADELAKMEVRSEAEAALNASS